MYFYSRIGRALRTPDILLKQKHEDSVISEGGEILLIIHFCAVLLYN